MLHVNRTLRIADVYPDKAQYLINQAVTIIVCLESHADGKILLRLCVNCLSGSIFSEVRAVSLRAGEERQEYFTFVPPQGSGIGFGADAEISAGEGTVDKLSTAFDVVDDWRDHIRYGFLSGFSAEDETDESDIASICKLHLNAVQFYDWMYRHDKLVPEQDNYLDPLGREMSLQAVRNKIGACEKMGMKPFAYGAIYAASKEFYKDHSDWGLYKLNGEPLIFGDWLMFMDISSGSPWSGHIVSEYGNAARSLGFKGIHMDTYGYPKSSYIKRDGRLEHMELSEHIPKLISSAKDRMLGVDGDSAVVLNAVNNWPIEMVAGSPQDSIYIEVWPPHVRYFHLYELVKHAKELGGKQVMLAAYLEPFKNANTQDEIAASQNALLLAFAVINASGGYHFVFGEDSSALCDAYYVNHAKLCPAFAAVTRRYMDHIVRYTELLHDLSLRDMTFTLANGINHEVNFLNAECSSTPEAGKVWSIVKQVGRRFVANLVNLCGIDNDLWNAAKPNRPKELSNIKVRFFLDAEVKGVSFASPDIDSSRPAALPFNYEEGVNGRYYLFTLPSLQIWDTVWIDY